MSTVSLTLSAIIDGTQQTITKSATIDDAVMPYFFAAYGVNCPKVDTGTKDANGEPVMRDPTQAEIFAYYASGIMNGSLANVRNYVVQEAIEQAKKSIPDININPN